MERQYLASYDTGHDYGSFTFDSEHRAGSKANKKDAEKMCRLKYGRVYRIIDITKYDAR